MALRFLPLKFLPLRSGVILGCELLRGQGFPDNLNVSGSVMTSADHEIVIPEVPDSGTWIWSLYVFLHVQCFSFRDCLCQQSCKDRALNSMAGNTISINVAGSMLAVLLASVFG